MISLAASYNRYVTKGSLVPIDSARRWHSEKIIVKGPLQVAREGAVDKSDIRGYG